MKLKALLMLNRQSTTELHALPSAFCMPLVSMLPVFVFIFYYFIYFNFYFMCVDRHV